MGGLPDCGAVMASSMPLWLCSRSVRQRRVEQSIGRLMPAGWPVFSRRGSLGGRTLLACACGRWRHRGSLAESGLPGYRPASPPAVADLMQLSPVPATPAPGFTLTDQNGHILSLASFRGRAVVLEFMDPHCTDICPIVSQEFIDADRDLGRSASRAVFIAVNVNPYFRSVADVAAYSQEHQLTAIPSWHFLTGSSPGPPAKCCTRPWPSSVTCPRAGPKRWATFTFEPRCDPGTLMFLGSAGSGCWAISQPVTEGVVR